MGVSMASGAEVPVGKTSKRNVEPPTWKSALQMREPGRSCRATSYLQVYPVMRLRTYHMVFAAARARGVAEAARLCVCMHACVIA